MRDLHQWSLDGSRLTESQVTRLATRLGQTLYRSFLGRPGTEVLQRVQPTAVMLAIDETLLSLPWELMPGPDGSWLDEVPVGRIVTTGVVPARGRDPKVEDPLVRILVVANPTGDLEAAEVESDAVVGMAGTHGDVRSRSPASRRRRRRRPRSAPRSRARSSTSSTLPVMARSRRRHRATARLTLKGGELRAG